MLARIKLLAIPLACLSLFGCGTSTRDCTPTPIIVSVSPATASANHAAASPGNQVQFTETSTGGVLPEGCAVPPSAFVQPWTSSDSTDIQFSNTQPGLATCVNPTSGAATITAAVSKSGATGKGTATLTCN